MAWLKDQETIAIEKIAHYIHRCQEEGARHVMGATQGSTRFGQEAEGMWTRAFIVVSAGRNRGGGGNRLRTG